MKFREGPKEPDILSLVFKTMVWYDMAAPGETVVVGVSGGVDSVSLLDILARLKPRFALRLVIAHVHHGLRREEGEREFRFVEALASRYKLPFEAMRVDASGYGKGGNVQARARRYRIRFFEEVAARWGAARIATGHHRDDHLETLLMQLLRGTGGLIGIPPVREGRFIRPLIEIPRSGIREYAREAGLDYCEDSSNQKRTYLRNRIRQELIPWIRREANPAFGDALLRFSAISREEGQWLDRLAEEAVERALCRTGPRGETHLRRDLLEGYPRALQRRVLRESYRRLAGSTQGLSHVHLEGICDALQRPGGRVHKQFSLPRGIRAFLEYDEVCLSRRDLWKAAPYEVSLIPGEKRRIPEAGMVLLAESVSCGGVPPRGGEDRECVFLDVGPTPGNLVVRNARAGDRFRPYGLGGEKKIKDFFIDRKIPRSMRNRIAILEIGGKIAWVVGQAVDDRFKVTEETRSMLRVQALPFGREDGTPGRRIRQIKR